MLRLLAIVIFAFSLLGCGGGGSSDSSDNNGSSNSGSGTDNSGTDNSGTDNSSPKSYRLVTIVADYDNDGNEDQRREFEYDDLGRITYHKISYSGDDVPDKVWINGEGSGIDTTQLQSLEESTYTYENDTDGQVKTLSERKEFTNSGMTNISTTNQWFVYNSDNLLSSIEIENVEDGSTLNYLLEYDGTNMTSRTREYVGVFSTTDVMVYDANNRVTEVKVGAIANATRFGGGRYTYTSDGKMKSITEGEFDTNAADPVLSLTHSIEHFFDGDKVDSYLRKFYFHDENSVGERYDLIFHTDGYIEEILIDRDDDGTIDGKETWVFEEAPCMLMWNTFPEPVWTYATASMEDSFMYSGISRMACM